MATTELNTALKGISGGIDNWVYRKLWGRTVISPRPIVRDAQTPAQEAHRARFRQAGAYVKAAYADLVKLAVYKAISVERNVPVASIMVADFFQPPTVDAIDLNGYHGTAGDPIVVRATDDVGVMAVKVVLRNAADAVVEQGAAVAEAGVWRYTATTTLGAGQDVSVEATATDRPGNTGAKLVGWVAP